MYVYILFVQSCLQDTDSQDPAASCAEIMITGLQFTPSGYYSYWLQSANGSVIHVFCDMTLTCKGVGGGWMQVAKLDMTNSSHHAVSTWYQTKDRST
jgi:hypothetical protein